MRAEQCCGPLDDWQFLCVQVVIIAAGYDSRAYRLSQPGVRFYEVDLPHASKRKQELVRKLLPADKVKNMACAVSSGAALTMQQQQQLAILGRCQRNALVS
jgi:O-methyltransferase involved in polyketide biosynthesis